MKETLTPSENQDTQKQSTERINPSGIRAMQGKSDSVNTRKEQSASKDAPPIHVPRNKELFLSDCKPNAVYEKNGYTYYMDEFGRPLEVTGKLKLKEGIQTKQQTDIGNMGRLRDDGGHLIGRRFDGPPDAFNIRPQYLGLNRGQWEAMENSWAKSLQEGKDVSARIELQYIAKSLRPSRYYVDYEVDGKHFHKRFTNRTPSGL